MKKRCHTIHNCSEALSLSLRVQIGSSLSHVFYPMSRMSCFIFVKPFGILIDFKVYALTARRPRHFHGDPRLWFCYKGARLWDFHQNMSSPCLNEPLGCLGDAFKYDRVYMGHHPPLGDFFEINLLLLTKKERRYFPERSHPDCIIG